MTMTIAMICDKYNAFLSLVVVSSSFTATTTAGAADATVTI